MKFIEFQTNLLVKQQKMYKCQDCDFATNWSFNLIRHEKFKHNPSDIKQIYNCHDCAFSTNWKSNLKRHEKFNHKDSEPIEHMSNVYFSHQPTNTVSSTNPNDIRLKENFKVFISGPSRCGKLFFRILKAQR